MLFCLSLANEELELITLVLSKGFLFRLKLYIRQATSCKNHTFKLGLTYYTYGECELCFFFLMFPYIYISHTTEPRQQKNHQRPGDSGGCGGLLETPERVCHLCVTTNGLQLGLLECLYVLVCITLCVTGGNLVDKAFSMIAS